MHRRNSTQKELQVTILLGDTDTDQLAADLTAYLTSQLPTSLAGLSGDLQDWLDTSADKLQDWLDTLSDHLQDWVDQASEPLWDAGQDAKADQLQDWLD